MEETGAGDDVVESPKCSTCRGTAVYEILGVDESKGNFCCEVCLGMWYRPDIRRL